MSAPRLRRPHHGAGRLAVRGPEAAAVPRPRRALALQDRAGGRGHGQRGSAHRRAHPGADQVKINGDMNSILIIYTGCFS